MAAAMASGYDLSVATFSPDGRVFQVEYASKAAESTGLVVGGVFKDGALLAVDKMLTSKLMVQSSSSRVFRIAPHIICAVSGFLPDGRQLINRARLESSEYKKVWGLPIPGTVLTERLGLYIHAHTAVWSTRPFGANLLIAVTENAEPAAFPASGCSYVTDHRAMDDKPSESPTFQHSLWMLDSTGASFKYKATAMAKGSSSAKSDLERLNFQETTIEEAVKLFAKTLQKGHQEDREKAMLVEMIWLRDGKAELVPQDLIDQANEQAIAALEAEIQGDAM